jgi:hypothetical protein
MPHVWIPRPQPSLLDSMNIAVFKNRKKIFDLPKYRKLLASGQFVPTNPHSGLQFDGMGHHQPPGLGGASFTYIDAVDINSGSYSQTHGMSASASDRVIFCGFGAEGNEVTAVTVDGEVATKVVEADDTNPNQRSYIYTAAVGAGGTTGTYAVTTGGGRVGMVFGAIYGTGGGEAASNSNGDGNFSVSSINFSLTDIVNGLTICTGCHSEQSNSMDWDGSLSEHVESTATDGIEVNLASKIASSAGAQTYTLTLGGSARVAATGAVFGPG